MPVLPDVLAPNLKIVFCGTAVSKQSNARQAYYAGDGNKFWPTLCSVQLVDRLLRPSEYTTLLSCRIGLTDLAKEVSGADADIKPSDVDVERVRKRILDFEPYAIAFTSQKAGRYYLGRKPSWGLQQDTIGSTRIYVLPSTSGLANASWDESWWQQLANDVQDVC